MKIALAAVAAMLACAPAMATRMTVTGQKITSVDPEMWQLVEPAAFDPSLGTLNWAYVKLNYVDQLAGASTPGWSSQVGDLPTTYHLNATTGIAHVAGVTFDFAIHGLTIVYPAFDFFVRGSVSQYVPDDNLSAFIGTGTLPISAWINGSAVTSTPSTGHWEPYGWTDNAQVSIIYDYTPFVAPDVPEPATWTLMLIGFGAIGVARRRRNPRLVTGRQ